ncbi:MAG: glycosyltransferase family 4 protein [SAR324 cluster bacterium]|nr:glycosyltransferase family 4 protein [SAR324 cluster bacterium]
MGRNGEADFNGREIASDGGALLPRQPHRRPMHIFHVAISKGWNAETAQAAAIIRAQVARSHRITAYVLADSPLFAELSQFRGDLHLYTQNHYDSATTPLRLWRLLKKAEPDLVHFHRNRGAIALGLALRGLERRIPAVRSLRDRLRPRPWVPYRSVYGYFDRLIFPNRYVESLLAALGGGALPSAFLPSPVDTARFVPKDRKGHPPRVGLFARFDSIKGHRYFLEACGSLIQSGAHPRFQIVLSGKNFARHRDAVLGLAAEAGVTEHCLVLDGAVRFEEELSRLDIGVVASIGSEKLTRVPLEYMACGIPVVATAVGGLPELITRDVGFLVPPGDPGALAKAVARLLNDGDLRKKLGATARRTVEEKHALPRVAVALERLYRAVLAGSGVGAQTPAIPPP